MGGIKGEALGDIKYLTFKLLSKKLVNYEINSSLWTIIKFSSSRFLYYSPDLCRNKNKNKNHNNENNNKYECIFHRDFN